MWFIIIIIIIIIMGEHDHTPHPIVEDKNKWSFPSTNNVVY